jgi:transposase
MKAVPGRKTDVKDAEWIADLLRHGLLRASFIPPQPVRDLRELTRYHATLVAQRTQAVNRLHQLIGRSQPEARRSGVRRGGQERA